MASLVKQHNRYYLQFYDGSQSPKRKRVALRTTRKRPAQRKQHELEDAFVEGRFNPWSEGKKGDPFHYDEPETEPLKISEALGRFLQRKKEEDCSKHTVRTYREVVGLLRDRIGEGRYLDTLKCSVVRSFVRDTDVAAATQFKRYGHLRTFFGWCRSEGYMTTNPLSDVSKPKKPDSLPKAITPGQLESLCESLREDYSRKRSKRWVEEGQMVWRIPLFWFALYTGMRRSELARLRWKHVDFDQNVIYIYEQKNGKEQTIPLGRQARKVLLESEHLREGEPGNFIFRSPNFEGEDRSSRNFGERASESFRKARRRAGLPNGLSFHSLRHGTATALAEAGKSATTIKEVMRHADIQTSLRYVHMANEHLKDMMDDVF